MSDLRDLYQEVILDHNKRPRNFRTLDPATHHADGHNPLCGDRVTVYAEVDDHGVIRDVAFQGNGCAISTASASLMTEALKGKTVQEFKDLFAGFHQVVTGTGEADNLGKLAILAGVRDYPSRVKCATLAWHTLQAALDNRTEPVKTE